MKVALYARDSSDSQRDASITDQLRVCRAHADKQAWQIVEEYSDHAISGASLLRSGIQALMADAQAGRFVLVLAEARTASRAIKRIAPAYSSGWPMQARRSSRCRAKCRTSMSASRTR